MFLTNGIKMCVRNVEKNICNFLKYLKTFNPLYKKLNS